MADPRPRVLVLNGPTTNFYGKMSPGVYGSEGLEAIEARCRRVGEALGLDVTCRQSSYEGALIDWIGAARGDCAAIVVNAAGAAYVSVALHDALTAFEGIVIEVHLSNTARREKFRRRSLVGRAALGTIAGFGPLGYELALQAVAARLADARA